MRLIRLAVLIAALSVCVGASDCSGSSGGGGSKSTAGFGSEETGPRDTVEGGGPTAPTPEPGGALLFGLGALIAAGAARRLKTPRD